MSDLVLAALIDVEAIRLVPRPVWSGSFETRKEDRKRPEIRTIPILQQNHSLEHPFPLLPTT